MGLPDGHVTAVPGLTRNQQLKLLGNGVVPQQAAAALRHLLDLAVGGMSARLAYDAKPPCAATRASEMLRDQSASTAARFKAALTFPAIGAHRPEAALR